MTAGLDIDRAAADLEEAPPEQVLRWAADALGAGVVFATGFGAEGCVIIDVIARHRLPIEVVTLDTGLLFPETHALWRALEARYAIAIRAIAPARTVDEQAAEHGPALWAREPDRCCALRKTGPLRAALAGRPGWVTAIRRDQTAARAGARVVERDPAFGLIKVNPLARWTHDDVWAHVYLHDVPVNALHAQGYPSIGCRPCTSAVAAGEDPRAGRWRGTVKTECGLHVGAPAAPAAPAAPEARGDG